MTLQKSEPTFRFLCRPAANSIEGARERREAEPQQAGAMAAPPKAWKVRIELDNSLLRVTRLYRLPLDYLNSVSV